MFLRRDEPILLTEEGIDGLCASLNRPVVDTEGLPAGPASSAIVLHEAESSERSLSLAIRFEDSGAVILFAFQGELNSSPRRALDAGLVFAEGMGFLFDEDIVEGGLPNARRQALEIWCQLTGEEIPPQALVSEAAAEQALLLDEVVDLDEEIEASARRLPPSATGLSKFRRSDDLPAPPRSQAASAAAPEESSTARLGRIPIVRRRRRGDSQPDAPQLLARLLARF